ncbi:AI-2E family transporter [Candidatus Saccharibacteria bacterium]|nr:AI-2E family transporter [Candidatus Saccharibacteria bacterium]
MAIFGKTNSVVSVSTRTIVKFIVLAVVAFLLLKIIGQVSHQLKLIFVSMLLAIGLNPAVGWITKRIKSKSRLRATGVAYVIVISLLVGFMAIVAPPLVKQTSRFISGIPDNLNNLKYQDTAFARTIRRYQLEDDIDELRQNFNQRFGNVSKPIINTAGRVGSIIVSTITVLILTFMMLVEGPLWVDKFIALQPESERKKRREVVNRMYKVVTNFFNGQVLIAFIAATFAAITLFVLNSLLGVSVNPIALSGIVFIFGLIPLIGNIIGSGVVVLVCLMSSLPMAAIMLGFFILYQQIENATLQPYIHSRSNQLTPLTVFIVAIIGASLAGILGALAAIPIAGCIKVLLDEYIIGKFPTLESFDKHIKS